MCSPDAPEKPAPVPPPPPVLKQEAPKRKSKLSEIGKKRKGFDKYKLDSIEAPKAKTSKIGGIPKKLGTG